MGQEYFLEPRVPLNKIELEITINWLLSVPDAVIHTNDYTTWYLFRDDSERKRRIQWWKENPTKNDYLTSYFVLSTEGIQLSLVEDDVDIIAWKLAKWWLNLFGGRLLDCGIEISPQDLLPN